MDEKARYELFRQADRRCVSCRSRLEWESFETRGLAGAWYMVEAGDGPQVLCTRCKEKGRHALRRRVEVSAPATVCEHDSPGEAAADLSEEAQRLLGSVPSGLFLATAGTGTNIAGTLLSFVQQISLRPPLLSLAIHPERAVHGPARERRRLLLHILPQETENPVRTRFWGGSTRGPRAFDGLEWRPHDEGEPVLEETLGYLELTVTEVFHMGDHDLFITRLIGGERFHDAPPAVHTREIGTGY